MDSGVEKITIEPAGPEDAPAILALQRLTYQSEAETFSDFTIKPLTQSLEELRKDFGTKTIFKAVMGSKVIGTVRTLIDKDTCHVKRLMINPAYQHHGIGRKLVEHAEKHFSNVKRFEVVTFLESKQNVIFYEGLRFTIFKKEKTPRGHVKIFMEKHV
ncbi:GNAT family N-acetyltransferase [Candidatus Omnitrophota bacterium]